MGAVVTAGLLAGAVAACSRHPAGHREPAAVEYAQLAEGGRVLTVFIDGSPQKDCSKDRRTVAFERPDVVKLMASEGVTAQACIGSAIIVPTQVTLRSPLGSRRLIDGVSGRAVGVR